MIVEFARFYVDGGFFMHSVILFGLGTLVVILVQLLADESNLTPAIIGGSFVTLFLGGIGTAVGFIQTFEAMATAPDDMKTQLLCAASAIALNPVQLALGLLILHVGLGSVSYFVRDLRTRKPRPNGEA